MLMDGSVLCINAGRYKIRDSLKDAPLTIRLKPILSLKMKPVGKVVDIVLCRETAYVHEPQFHGVLPILII